MISGMSNKKLTQATVKTLIKGMATLCGRKATVRYRDGEWSVCVDGNEDNRYHTNDAEDVIMTASAMLRHQVAQ